MAPVVEAYQSMRGVAFLTAVTFMAEIGDVRRFETPRQLMAYLGLVPSERSTGAQVWRGSITKAGNPRARRVLIEGAWTYRYPARLSRPLQVRQESLSTVVQAWRRRRAGAEHAEQPPAQAARAAAASFELTLGVTGPGSTPWRFSSAEGTVKIARSG